MAGQNIAALGFRAHTGWAAAVAVTPNWEVIERRRIAYEPETTRFIYHHAAEIGPDEAEALIAAAHAQAVAKAELEIGSLVSALSGKGMAVAAACVPGGRARLPNSLREILAVHARIHAAEGAFYRDALVEACAPLGLNVTRAPERDLWTIVAGVHRCNESALRSRMAQLGKQLGPPWGEDQKLATLAALVALDP